MSPSADLDALSPAELKALVLDLLGKMADLERTVAAQHGEIARLKGLKGRPPIKPSGMEQGTEPKPSSRDRPGCRRRGKVVPRVAVEERVIRAAVPPGSRFGGYQDFLVQDLVLRTEAVRYRCVRWLTPDGRLVVAPLPCAVEGHFGPELRRFVLAQYHQGQTTVPRLDTQLRGLGIVISRRQGVRMPAREWTAAKAQFAILFEDRSTTTRSTRSHTKFLTVPVGANCAPASTASSAATPASSSWIACSRGCTSTSPSCCVCSTALRSRCTPTAR